MLTCSKSVLDLEANALQLIVTEEADPHESPAGEDQSWTDRAAEAVDERWETERAVPNLDVVEATLEGSLDVELLIKQQLDPLTRQRWEEDGRVRSAAKEVITGNFDFFISPFWPNFVEIVIWMFQFILCVNWENTELENQSFKDVNVGISFNLIQNPHPHLCGSGGIFQLPSSTYKHSLFGGYVWG